MRTLTVILVLIGLTFFNSCKKETVIVKPITVEEPVVVDTAVTVMGTFSVYYDETFCANPWGGSYYDTELEKNASIENYFNDLEIELFEIEKTEVGSPETFFLCVAKTGYIIEFKIREKDVEELINEGFYN